MEDRKLIIHLEGLLRQALPFLEMVDLMGTGGFVPKNEYEELNALEKEIADAADEDVASYGNHSKSG